MKKTPSLSDMAQIAEIVAAGAVVVSLLYFGLELRRNTAAVRASSTQAVTSASSAILLTTASDSALSRIRQVGDRKLSALTDAEAYRYHTLIRQVWLTMQNAYTQNELDVIEPRIWRSYERVICSMRSNRGIRDSWPLHRQVLDPGFANMVESCPEG